MNIFYFSDVIDLVTLLLGSGRRQAVMTVSAERCIDGLWQSGLVEIEALFWASCALGKFLRVR